VTWDPGKKHLNNTQCLLSCLFGVHGLIVFVYYIPTSALTTINVKTL
jgi:hypothetical protein